VILLFLVPILIFTGDDLVIQTNSFISDQNGFIYTEMALWFLKQID